ncbi:MAG TPA: hypothetical protein DEA08_15035, partial [Planctomycetes bacterium]|nr:hypothetical protein [Planctomycetota bacterium]
MRIGDYELRGELARGGQATVFRAWDASVGREVALKLIERVDATRLARFARESEALGRLRHPGIVPVHAAGEHEGRPYLVMDLVDGESLATRLEREGPLPLPAASALIAELADAIAHAHEMGVLHRDLKPDNVLLDREGRVLLTDFGLARLHRSDLSKTGQILGTPGYFAPELAQGSEGNAAEAVDVYGLGATLYACLTARPPHVGETLAEVLVSTLERMPPLPSSLRPDGDARLDALCRACLARDPARRPASALALAEALRAPHSQRSAGVSPLPLALGALALVALVAGLALATRPADQAPTPTASASASPTPVAVLPRWRPRPDERRLLRLREALEIRTDSLAAPAAPGPPSLRFLRFELVYELELHVREAGERPALRATIRSLHGSLEVLENDWSFTSEPPAPRLPKRGQHPEALLQESRRYSLRAMVPALKGQTFQLRADASGRVQELDSAELRDALITKRNELSSRLAAHLGLERRDERLSRIIAYASVVLDFADANHLKHAVDLFIDFKVIFTRVLVLLMGRDE